MESLADRTIDALRANHAGLAAVVPGLSDEQLTGPSGASEWTVAQVLSHLGSGAEITLAGLQSALAGRPAPGGDFNQSVWDRWNASSPQEQAAGFLRHDDELVSVLESLTATQRETLTIELGFAPAPLSLATLAGMRLNEAALHSWDVHVAFDPDAAVAGDAATVLVEQFAGGLGFLLGFIGRADALAEPAVVEIQGTDRGLVIGEGVSITDSPGDATATFVGPPDAVVRLLSGRLTPPRTPPDVSVSGNVTLDDLRRVFPGY